VLAFHQDASCVGSGKIYLRAAAGALAAALGAWHVRKALETARQADENARKKAEDDEEILERYDKNNPIRGIQQITKGFAKWAQRYISTCKVQPDKQVIRMQKWNDKMNDYLKANVVA